MADNAEGCNNVWGFSVEQMNYYGRLTPVHQAELPTLFCPSPDERVGEIKNDLEKLIMPDNYDFFKEVRPVQQAISMREFNTQRFQETLSLNMLVKMLFPYPCLESTADATMKLLLSDIENNDLNCSLYPWQDSYYPEDEKFKIKRKLSDGWSYGQVFSDLDCWDKRKAKVSIKNFKSLIDTSYKPWRPGQACPISKHLMSTLRIWESYAGLESMGSIDNHQVDDSKQLKPANRLDLQVEKIGEVKKNFPRKTISQVFDLCKKDNPELFSMALTSFKKNTYKEWRNRNKGE